MITSDLTKINQAPRFKSNCVNCKHLVGGCRLLVVIVSVDILSWPKTKKNVDCLLKNTIPFVDLISERKNNHDGEEQFLEIYFIFIRWASRSPKLAHSLFKKEFFWSRFGEENTWQFGEIFDANFLHFGQKNGNFYLTVIGNTQVNEMRITREFNFLPISESSNLVLLKISVGEYRSKILPKHSLNDVLEGTQVCGGWNEKKLMTELANFFTAPKLIVDEKWSAKIGWDG